MIRTYDTHETWGVVNLPPSGTTAIAVFAKSILQLARLT